MAQAVAAADASVKSRERERESRVEGDGMDCVLQCVVGGSTKQAPAAALAGLTRGSKDGDSFKKQSK